MSANRQMPFFMAARQLCKLGGVMALATAIASCAVPPSMVPDLGDYQAAPRDLIGISSITDAYVVRTSRGTIPKLERERLAGFVKSQAANRPESLRVVLHGASIAAMSGVRRELIIDGIDPRHIAFAGPSSEPPGGIVINVERAIAVQPACPGWLDHSSAPEHNRTEPNFGCSDVSNFAAMVGDPHNLIVGASNIYHDGERGAGAVASYRADKVKDLPALNEQFTVIPAAH